MTGLVFAGQYTDRSFDFHDNSKIRTSVSINANLPIFFDKLLQLPQAA